MPNKNLSDFEKYILFEKGTEPPFSGEYNDFFENGIYVCKNCGNELYCSDSKFRGHCGWPSFDGQINNNVRQIPDKDGIRIEIVCAKCEAHLGHVFYGEGFTNKNVRHCVNSVSLLFLSQNENK
ncbi:methionine-R-sulfoxide reductase [Helicobacter didelphidarum]|uniref:peptide-methionine (R)-S-oxide reductase n=1 Tax=Helicobacter didelphidarum TaxID=2040648 RepID=A0A3D8IBZ8_9HELI|nr:methionine-R-sulfoxide reductase [Helicobacter didelphidarum]RDU62687.1 methionine-R-sulfoxide reductase [Helicobacter didelphidarum]